MVLVFILLVFYFGFLKFLVALGYVIGVLVSTAYLTLLERKLMAGVQRRQGPNIVGKLYGLLQPLVDGLKLIFKRSPRLIKVNIYYYISPLASLSFSLLPWGVIPLGGGNLVENTERYSLLWVLLLSSVQVFPLLCAGVSSGSIYALLGGIRAATQFISYEIVLGLSYVGFIMILQFFFCRNPFSLYSFLGVFGLLLVLLPFSFILLVVMFAEAHRAPFDLVECESELVSGYHVEYSSTLFASFFLAEYVNILFHSVMVGIVVFGVSSVMIVMFVCVIFILVRCSVPRLRFDQLIHLCWNNLLPLLLFFLVIEGIILFIVCYV
uniref:NADH dehydrogenase subunit 1 n=1 Tax=Polypodium hydriforme TaxID=43186 RepID=UPI0021145964|nr:NADH dehydrogenase subunit 1 [Polypodium hydriforme]USZ79615.1 NADH dehydrogenase subunit 1 [Polypodium hydriforme]